MGSHMKRIDRAETPAEKIAKGEFILVIAERIARDTGLDGLSMNALSAACNVAKVTLYLYFKTRHEILAALFVKSLGDWIARFERTLTHTMSYDEFCQTYAATLIQDDLILPLMHAAHDQFDAGLPDETYQEMMESFQQMLDRQEQIFCDALNIDSETASRAVWAFYTAALGAGHFGAVERKRAALSSDIVHFRDALRFETMFLNVVSQLNLGGHSR